MKQAVTGFDAGRHLLGAGMLLCLGALVVALLLMSPPTGRVVHAEPVKVGLIPTETGVGDMSFNWMAHEGLLRAETDLGVVGTVYTPTDPDDYAAKIQQCADDANVLCLTVGFTMADATFDAAEANPGVDFATVDATWESYPDNLRGLAFAVEEAAYLAGRLAELMTDSDLVGVVAGMEVPPVQAFTEPFGHAVGCANSYASVVVTYTNTFGDPVLGADAAQQQMDDGADVIFGCGGLTGNGAIVAAAQAGAWAIGVDVDQWLTVFDSGAEPGSERLLTSVMKRIDNAVYDTITDDVGGQFTPGTVEYGLASDGVGLAPYHEADASIPQAVKDAIEAAKQEILDGTVDPWQSCGLQHIYLPLVVRGYAPPKIILWHTWTGEYLQEYRDVVADFNLANPDKAVGMVYVCVEDMGAALATAIPAGTGPDILAHPNDMIGQWASEGYLAPLDAWIDLAYLQANFEPNAIESVLWDGEIWGIPESQEGIALVYNTDLIGEGQLPEPGDFAGLLTQADLFQQAHPGLFYLCNQGLGNPDAYHAAPIYFGHGLGQYGGYVDAAGTAYMTTPEALDAAEWIASFSQNGPAETSHEICRDLLVNGEAGIWWTGPWAIGDLQSAGLDYGIATMGIPFVGVKDLMLTTNAVDRGHDDAAVYFMQYLGSAAVQKRLALANRTIPANTAALNDPDVQALYEVAQFAASLSLGIPMANHVYGPCQWEPVGEATTAIWDGTQTPEEAMDAAQAAIEDCVAGAGSP